MKTLRVLQWKYDIWKQLKESQCKRTVKKWELIIDRVYYRFRNLKKLNAWFDKEKLQDYGDYVAFKSHKLTEEVSQPMSPLSNQEKDPSTSILNNRSRTGTSDDEEQKEEDFETKIQGCRRKLKALIKAVENEEEELDRLREEERQFLLQLARQRH